MAELRAPEDEHQGANAVRERNGVLARQLDGAWNRRNITTIRREPNPNDDTRGTWVATTTG